jgi:hypothetical protein
VTEIVGSGEFEAWFLALTDADGRGHWCGSGLLEARGAALGFPYSSAVQGSKFALRELRVQSAGHPLRVIYAFDPKRQAVLLLGGDKTGDDRFYERIVPKAEEIWMQYLKEQEDPSWP